MKLKTLVDATNESRKTIEISASDYEELVFAQTGIYEALAIEEKFDLVTCNYFEFEKILHQVAISSRLFVATDWVRMIQDLQSANGALMNLLAIFRAYIDHVPHHMGEIFGKNSVACNDFQKSLRKEYDSVLGYRLIYALRNYVQHRGFPIQYLDTSLRAGRKSDGRLEVKCMATPYLLVSQLREEPKFKKEILSEIESIGEKVDLKRFTRESISSISRINKIPRMHVSNRYKDWKSSVFEIQRRCVELIGGSSKQYVALDSETGRRLNIMPMLFYRFDYLVMKNEKFSGLDVGFATE